MLGNGLSIYPVPTLLFPSEEVSIVGLCVCVFSLFPRSHFHLFAFNGTLKTHLTGSQGTASDIVCMLYDRNQRFICSPSLNPVFVFPAPRPSYPGAALLLRAVVP